MQHPRPAACARPLLLAEDSTSPLGSKTAGGHVSA